MTRFASLSVMTAIAAVFFSIGATVANAAMDSGGPPPPPPPPTAPASNLGEIPGSSAQLALQTTTFQYMLLARWIRNAGTGGGWNGATGTIGAFQPHEENAYSRLASFDEGYPPVIRGQISAATWGSWIGAYNIGGHVDGTPVARGLDYSANGIQLGIYRELGCDSLLGMFGGYTRQNSEYEFWNGTAANIDSGQLGVFLRRGDVRDYWLFAGAAAYDSYYTARDPTARGAFDGSQVSAYLERGWSRSLGRHWIEPSIALQYTGLHQDGFVETGAGVNNLTYGESNTNSLRSVLGARCITERRILCGLLHPELRAFWVHEYLDTTTSVIIAAGGPPATATGIGLGRDWAMLGTGVTLDVGGRVSLFADYDLQLNDRTSLHVFSGGARW